MSVALSLGRFMAKLYSVFPFSLPSATASAMTGKSIGTVGQKPLLTRRQLRLARRRNTKLHNRQMRRHDVQECGQSSDLEGALPLSIEPIL